MIDSELLEVSLEELVDQSDIDQVIRALATVCHMKAQHVAENWQDSVTTRYWKRIGNALDRIEV